MISKQKNSLARFSKAFTLVEVMIVVAIILILVAIIVPGFLRYRHNVNELLAAKGLRSLSDSLELYRIEKGDYPDALPASLNAFIPYITDPAIVQATSTSQKPYRGYYFDYTRPVAGGYRYIAKPASSGSTGTKQFIVDEGGTVREYTESAAPPPSTSCPYIYVWDGLKYVKDNDIIPIGDIYKSGEYTDYYLLSKVPAVKDGKFYLKITEEVSETSYLDRINLLMIEHPLDTLIAPDPEGNIWTIQNPIIPISAVDQNNQDILYQLKERGGEFSEIDKGGWMIIDFGKFVSENGARIVLSSDPVIVTHPSAHIQILNNENQWQEVGVIHPHEFWDLWAIDLSAFLVKDQDIMIRIYFTQKHKIDYIALDTSKQQSITKTELPIVDISSSLGIDNAHKIIASDNNYAVMNKGDYVELGFPAYSQSTVKRDFLFISEGYYVSQANAETKGE